MDVPLESLLRHSAWVERLARRLVRDPEAADELVQETWLAVLQAGEVPVRSARAWLATVLRSRLADRRRGVARRERHEQAAARGEAQPSTEELFLRTTAQHEVVEAVLALDEPYREVILRRYFQGEPPRVIAARLGLPLATVKTRLARALARLRTTLDERHGGDGKRWLLALVPLVRRARLAPSLGLLLAVGLVAGFLATRPFRAERGPGGGKAALAARAPGVSPGPAAESTLTAADSSPVRALLAPGGAGEVPAGPGFAWLVRGTVVDEHDAPLSGLVLELRPADGSARRIALSGAHGEFELTTTSAACAVHVLDERRVTAWAGLTNGGADELRVVAAPAVALRGRVVDENGGALAGVAIALELPPPLSDAPASAPVEVRAETDVRGEFRLEGLPDVPGAALVFTTPGHALRRLVLAQLAGPLRVELAREGDWTTLRGRVLDARGAPLAGAFVAGGASWTRAGADGSFELRAEHVPAQILALAEGCRPVRAPVSPDRPAGAELELVLAEPALAVRGRVLDHDGTPCSGAWVWVEDPEALVPFALDAAERIDALPRLPGLGGPRPAVPLVESVLAGTPEVGWRRVVTGPGGAFELGGLVARSYRLAVLEPESLRLVQLAEVPAGAADVVLRFAPTPEEKRRTVRVRAPDGTALAEVRVTLERAAFRVPAAGAALWSERAQRPLAYTDAEGRVELELAAGPGLELRFDGAAVLARTIPLDELTPDGGVELERACFLTLTVGAACELGARDRNDAACEVEERGAGERRRRLCVPLAAGETRRLVLGERVQALVLVDSAGAVRRLPVALVPGATLVLAP